MSSSSEPIILFDLASQPPCKTWSYNPWKTRLCLNYKGLEYKTVFLDYPEIKPTIAPHLKEQQDLYTIPTIRLPSGEYIMDSLAIARALDASYPDTPSLHLDDPVVGQVLALLPKIASLLAPANLPLIPGRLLREPSHEQWIAAREARLGGVPLSEVQRTRGGRPCYQKPEVWEALAEMTALLRRRGRDEAEEEEEGPFFLGREPSFADFVWAGWLLFTRRIGDDVWGWLVEALGGDVETHERLLEAVRPWAERDDY